jgi:hypothetical protein
MSHLFDTKTVTVYSSSSSLYEQSDDPITTVALSGILNNTSISAGIGDYCLNGMASKARRAYIYGRDSYTLGLPSGVNEEFSASEYSSVTAILEKINGGSVYIHFSVITTLTTLLAITPWLMENRGYNYYTETVSSYPFTIKNNASAVYVSSVTKSGSNAIITYYYTYKTYGDGGDSYVKYETETVAIGSSYSIGEKYCIAAYYSADSSGNATGSRKYWFYRIADGTYDIDSTSTDISDAIYMPVIPIRYDNEDLTSDDFTDTELYTTSKKLLGKLDIDIDDIADLLNESSSVDSIDHAYVMFGIDLLTEDEIDIQYLMLYFEYLGDIAAYGEEEYLSNTDSDYTNEFATERYSTRTDTPTEGLLSYGLNFGIGFNYIRVTYTSGSIGDVGTYASEYGTDYGYTTERQEGNEDESVQQYYDNSWVSYKYQVSSNKIKVVTVYGLYQFNYGIYTGDTDGVGGSTGLLTNAYEAMEDSDSYRIIVPLHYGIATQLTLMEQNVLFGNSLQLVMNSYDITKLSWYEQGWFTVVVMVVTIIIIAYTGQTWLAGLVEVGGGLYAILMYLLKSTLMMLALKTAVTFIVEAIGLEGSLAIAAVIAVVSIYCKRPDAGITFLNGITITAETCMQAAMSVISSASSIMQSEIEAIADAMTAYEEYTDELWDELEESWDELYGDQLIDPLILISASPTQDFVDESPEEFYYRTIHVGNIGTSVLDTAMNYCDNMLQLPTLS